MLVASNKLQIAIATGTISCSDMYIQRNEYVGFPELERNLRTRVHKYRHTVPASDYQNISIKPSPLYSETTDRAIRAFTLILNNLHNEFRVVHFLRAG